MAPNCAQEMYEFAYDAFDLAETYRMPVMILADGVVGQMMEPVEFNKPQKKEFEDRDWALTGCKGRRPRSIKSLLMKDGILEKHNLDLQSKYKIITEKEVQYEAYMTDDAEIIITAFGISSRISKSAVKLARKEGIKAGLLRPKTLWPFPSETISSFAKQGTKFLSVELNHGQMVEDVRLAVGGKCPVEFFGKAGGGIVSQQEILQKIKEINK